MKMRSLGLAVGIVGALAAAAPNARADEPTPAAASTDANAAPPATTGIVATNTDEKITDVLEEKGKSYYFLGLNYRFTMVPQFMVNLFVDEGATFTTNSIGISFDYRKDHFSIIPGLNFTEYGFDPVLFLQKGKDRTDPGNWGVVHSTLKGVYLTMDLLWSVPIAKGGQVDFEFGMSVGLGAIFGELYNTWVADAPTGGPSFNSSTGAAFYQCTSPINPPTGKGGCQYNNHSGATPGSEKTGAGPGYHERNWFDNGGSVPTVFPWISLPILGFRFKPIKELEMRLNGGFSVTGFFFNLAAYYGFESPKTSPQSTPAH